MLCSHVFNDRLLDHFIDLPRTEAGRLAQWGITTAVEEPTKGTDGDDDDDDDEEEKEGYGGTESNGSGDDGKDGGNTATGSPADVRDVSSAAEEEEEEEKFRPAMVLPMSPVLRKHKDGRFSSCFGLGDESQEELRGSRHHHRRQPRGGRGRSARAWATDDEDVVFGDDDVEDGRTSGEVDFSGNETETANNEEQALDVVAATTTEPQKPVAAQPAKPPKESLFSQMRNPLRFIRRGSSTPGVAAAAATGTSSTPTSDNGNVPDSPERAQRDVTVQSSLPLSPARNDGSSGMGSGSGNTALLAAAADPADGGRTPQRQRRTRKKRKVQRKSTATAEPAVNPTTSIAKTSHDGGWSLRYV